VYEGGSGIPIPKGQFTEHELGFAMRADIVANGMAAHRKYGAYQLDDAEGTAVIEHMNGRRYAHFCSDHVAPQRLLSYVRLQARADTCNLFLVWFGFQAFGAPVESSRLRSV
jgi:hypothetical protein